MIHRSADPPTQAPGCQILSQTERLLPVRRLYYKIVEDINLMAGHVLTLAMHAESD